MVDVEYIGIIVPQLIVNIPYFLAWMVAIILARRMVVKGGGRAERLLLIGCVIMLAGAIAGPLLSGYGQWYVMQLVHEHGVSHVSASIVMSVIGIGRGIWSMAGIVCCVYAFYLKWKATPSAQ